MARKVDPGTDSDLLSFFEERTQVRKGARADSPAATA